MLESLALAGRILLVGYEKIVVKQLGEDASSGPSSFLFFFLATMSLVPAVIIKQATPVVPPVIFITGAVYACAFFLYVKALSISDVSLVGPLYNFNAFFLLLLSVVFLGESITILKVVGLVLLVAGASALNRGRGQGLALRALVQDRGAILMVLCSALMAVGRTLDGAIAGRYAEQAIDPLWYAFLLYAVISVYLFILSLLLGEHNGILKLLRERPIPAIGAGVINAYSYVLLLVAFQRFEVSVVEPATIFGIAVTVILAWILFKEKIAPRLPGIAAMAVGTALLFLQK